MRRIVLLLLLSCFAYMGITQAQESRLEGVNMNVLPQAIPVVSNDRGATDFTWLTYVPEDLSLENVTAVGIGMGFSWGAMFPASMLSQYEGFHIYKVSFLDLGNESHAGDYQVRIYLGGDTQGQTLVTTQDFQVTGSYVHNMDVFLDSPVLIDGAQNIWVMYYQDGSVAYPAPAMEVVEGEPNNQWIAIEGMGWFDLAQVGGDGYGWLVWAFADDTDMIGENIDEVAVFPNPTSGLVTIQANDMNHITMMNPLGQVVYDANTNCDLQTLDMGQYESGVYVLRVTTIKGVSAQRVVVK